MSAVFTVATYNIHKCVGRDGRFDPARIFAVLAELDADVIGIQEFDNRAHRPAITADDFAEATGYQVLECPALPDGTGYHGNLLLTRLNVRHHRVADISVGRYEPRMALIAEVDGPVEVAVSHFGLWPPARRTQAKRFVASLNSEHPVVALADLNEWLPFLGADRIIASRIGRDYTVKSFPARAPLVAYDRIWASPPLRLANLRAHRTPLSRVASDHLPVRAEIHAG